MLFPLYVKAVLRAITKLFLMRESSVVRFSVTEIADLHIEPLLHLTIGVLGKTDRAGLGDALKPGRNIDAVPHQVAIAFLDNVAKMDADAKLGVCKLLLRHTIAIRRR